MEVALTRPIRRPPKWRMSPGLAAVRTELLAGAPGAEDVGQVGTADGAITVVVREVQALEPQA